MHRRVVRVVAVEQRVHLHAPELGRGVEEPRVSSARPASAGLPRPGRTLGMSSTTWRISSLSGWKTRPARVLRSRELTRPSRSMRDPEEREVAHVHMPVDDLRSRPCRHLSRRARAGCQLLTTHSPHKARRFRPQATRPTRPPGARQPDAVGARARPPARRTSSRAGSSPGRSSPRSRSRASSATSRGPIREALGRLAAEGLVTHHAAARSGRDAAVARGVHRRLPGARGARDARGSARRPAHERRRDRSPRASSAS